MTYLDPISFARLRRRLSDSYERGLWQCLRDRRLRGKKFRRQYPLGPFTADFFCLEALLVVEIDGASHFTPERRRYDAARDLWMARRGIRVLRFTGKQIECDLRAVLATIEQALVEQSQSSPTDPGPSASHSSPRP